MKLIQQIKYIFIVSTLFLSISLPSCYANVDDYFLQPRPHTSKKTELKNVLKKFGKAMSLVCVSGIGLFMVLTIYRKATRRRNNTSLVDLDKTLTSPDTIEDATKFVIEKF